MKKTNPRLGIVSLAAAALLGGCAVSTPQSRIATNPALYDTLTSSQKGLVGQGKITEGMTKEAVFLAWGKADYVKSSSDHDKVVETWIYKDVEPVYTSYGYGGYGYGGYGYGYRHHYGRGYHYDPYCYDFGPTVSYRSYVAGKVSFRNGRVTQWETTR
jgi:hypothetical protein